ncbi:MAG: hypothetical protein WCK07_23270 [Betaproteobacteria bacterium]|jgi:hypothetical protein
MKILFYVFLGAMIIPLQVTSAASVGSDNITTYTGVGKTKEEACEMAQSEAGEGKRTAGRCRDCKERNGTYACYSDSASTGSPPTTSSLPRKSYEKAEAKAGTPLIMATASGATKKQACDEAQAILKKPLTPECDCQSLKKETFWVCAAFEKAQANRTDVAPFVKKKLIDIVRELEKCDPLKDSTSCVRVQHHKVALGIRG